MLWGGVALSLLDVVRRVAIENTLRKEEATEVAELMRESTSNNNRRPRELQVGRVSPLVIMK